MSNENNQQSSGSSFWKWFAVVACVAIIGLVIMYVSDNQVASDQIEADAATQQAEGANDANVDINVSTDGGEESTDGAAN